MTYTPETPADAQARATELRLDIALDVLADIARGLSDDPRETARRALLNIRGRDLAPSGPTVTRSQLLDHPLISGEVVTTAYEVERHPLDCAYVRLEIRDDLDPAEVERHLPSVVNTALRCHSTQAQTRADAIRANTTEGTDQ